MKKDVKQYLDWVHSLIHSSKKEREELKEVILDSMRKSKNKHNRKMVEFIEDGQFDFIGFCPNTTYIAGKGSSNDLKTLWIHPWGFPPLLFKHKLTSSLVMINPLIRFNDTVFSMNESGYKKFVLGITG